MYLVQEYSVLLGLPILSSDDPLSCVRDIKERGGCCFLIIFRRSYLFHVTQGWSFRSVSFYNNPFKWVSRQETKWWETWDNIWFEKNIRISFYQQHSDIRLEVRLWVAWQRWCLRSLNTESRCSELLLLCQELKEMGKKFNLSPTASSYVPLR